MNRFASRNRAFFGAREVSAGGKKVTLDWGARRVTMSDGEKKISVSNQAMAGKLGRMKLEDFITREFRRVS